MSLCCQEERRSLHTSTTALLEDGLSQTASLIGSTSKDVVKFSNQNKRFYNNIKLALTVAGYVTLFGLPVYSTHVSWYIFGEKNRLVGDEFISMCGSNMMGVKINVGSDKTPELVNYNSTHIADGLEPDVWCGLLPESYFAAWPSVVQTIIFTVFQSTGSTVKLAWQCIAGTFCAVFNIYLLTLLFPHGAADPNYNPIVAWADLLIVFFLFLASKADQNTMMMGMNWTVALMLHFMNPLTGNTLGSYKSPIPFVNIDGETTVVMLTSTLGCLLAVAATSFPYYLGNLPKVRDDAQQVTAAIDNIFSGAIDYWSQENPGPKRFQVFAKMSALSASTSRVTSNLNDSYWECFDLCKFGRIRKLYGMFNNSIIGNSEEVYLIKAALGSIDFEAKPKPEQGGSSKEAVAPVKITYHNELVKATKGSVMTLKQDAIRCLQKCEGCCADGRLDEKEIKEIGDMIKAISDTQQKLSNEFQMVCQKLSSEHKLDYISETLAPDSLFLFSLSQWAEEIKDFADDLRHVESRQMKYLKNPFAMVCGRVCSMFCNLFEPSGMFEKEQLRFTAMNGIPILVTYIGSMYLHNSVFIPYSATMPGTLTLLVTYDYGATFFKNVQRLMGVVFGHTLPLLVMSVITMLDCDNTARFALHSSTLFVFYFMFTFMYYSSEMWSTVGVCIAGFGCYPMFHQCDNTGAAVDYGAQYKDIAQVIIAIILKMAVANMLSPAEPRDNAIKVLQELQDAVNKSFEAFFAGNIHGDTGLDAHRMRAKTALTACKTIAPKCDPGLQIVPGSRTGFKHNLYNKALETYQLVLSDLDMLSLALTGHVEKHSDGIKISAAEKAEDAKEATDSKKQENAIFGVMAEQTNFKSIRQDLMETVSVTTNLLDAVLSHDTEEPLKNEAVDQLKKMEKITTLDGVTEFYSEVSKALARQDSAAAIFKDQRIVTQLRRTRLTVAMNSLVLATAHMADIAACCFQDMLYS